MRVGKPGVQREQRHLDCKRQKERCKKQKLGPRRQQNHSRLQLRLNIRQIKRSGQVVQPQNRHQHQHGAEHGVQNKFHRGINSSPVSPDSNQEIHRNQREFPEEEKEQQIERDENADHGRFDHQQRNEKSFHVFLNGLPRA